MPKPAIVSDDPLVMKVRELLKAIEPRELPTETIRNDWGHEGWKCPYCGAHCPRKDTSRLRAGRYVTIIDYAGYNMHFAHTHATPFWKENQLIALIKRELGGQSHEQK